MREFYAVAAVNPPQEFDYYIPPEPVWAVYEVGAHTDLLMAYCINERITRVFINALHMEEERLNEEGKWKPFKDRIKK